MKDEIEFTFIDIDVEDIRARLQAYGATHQKTYVSKRKLMDFPGLPLEAQNKWLRLRDEGDKVTLTYKERKEKGWLKELETVVSDFDTMEETLKMLGFIEKRYEENKREKWVSPDGVVFDIDTWPLLPTYIEIEGDTEEKVQEAALALGFDWDSRKRASPLEIYAHYGIDIKEYTVITFEQQVKKSL